MEDKEKHLMKLVNFLVESVKRSAWADVNVSLATERTKQIRGEALEVARCMAVDEKDRAAVLEDAAYMNLMDEISRVLKKS